MMEGGRETKEGHLNICKYCLHVKTTCVHTSVVMLFFVNISVQSETCECSIFPCLH